MRNVHSLLTTGLNFLLKMANGDYNKEKLTDRPFDKHILNTTIKEIIGSPFVKRILNAAIKINRQAF